MKTFLGLVLAVSLLLNATYAYLYFKRAAPPPVPGGDTAPTRAGRAKDLPRIDAQVWGSLQAGDLPDLVTRLRAAGFPPATVRAIVAAQVRASFAARRNALLGSAAAAPFWKTPQRDPNALAAMRQLDREEQNAVRDLLGEAEPDDPLARLTLNGGLEFLPADKAAEVRRIIREYEERRSDVFAAGYASMVDREKITALEKEQRAAIARMLTPQEFFEYDLRRSNTANSLREELSAFQPTEEEYRAIFSIRAAFDERFSSFIPGRTPEEMRQRSEAQRLMKEQIKAVLPPDRAAEYERMTDFNYRRTNQLVGRLELPPETTDQLFAMQKEYEQRRNDLYRGASRTADREQINEQLKVMQQEATARVAPLLGGMRGVEAYKQYGGSWITSLIPRPAPTPAAPRP